MKHGMGVLHSAQMTMMMMTNAIIL